MQTTLARIQGFAQFQPGWSYGEGIGFAQRTLHRAMQLAKTAHTLGFHETDAFPGLNGEVMFTVYRGDEYWEFTLHPTDTLTFAYEKGEQTLVYEEGLPFELFVQQPLSAFHICDDHQPRPLAAHDLTQAD